MLRHRGLQRATRIMSCLIIVILLGGVVVEGGGAWRGGGVEVVCVWGGGDKTRLRSWSCPLFFWSKLFLRFTATCHKSSYTCKTSQDTCLDHGENWGCAILTDEPLSCPINLIAHDPMQEAARIILRSLSVGDSGVGHRLRTACSY